MTIFLDTRETADRFGDYIEELRAIFVANNIKFGSPDNFFEFARRLQSDDLLPGDLSRMIESITERENDDISPRTILTIIAIAVGGTAVSEPDHDLSKSVKLVVDFLVRSGNCSSADPQHLDTMCMAPFAAISNPEKNLSSEEPSLSLTDLPDDEPSHQIDTAPLHPFPDSSKLIESLARLELNATQARLYLDSIEQRISRMEPYLENLPSLASSPPDLAEPQHPTDSLVDSPFIPRDIPPPNFVRQASPHPNEHLAWAFVLGRKLAAPPLLATLAGGTLLYIGYSRGPAKTGITPAAPDAATTISQPSAAAIASIPEPQYALPDEPTENTIKPQPAKPSAARLLKRDTPASKTIRHQKPHPIESPPDNAPQRSILHADVEEADTPQPNESTDVVARTKRDVSYTLTHAPARSAPSSPRVVNVSSGVMAANLVSASPPSYPKLAGLTHMQGEVVMQAIISKDGTVENLHVIQGHRLLRGAAKNSARTWRYRPYLVNGKPVEVATIVSVDFTLGH